MPVLDPLPIAPAAVGILGVLLIVSGLYVQRRGKLSTRQGAAVLASFAAVIGVVVVGGAAIAFMAATWPTTNGWFRL